MADFFLHAQATKNLHCYKFLLTPSSLLFLFSFVFMVTVIYGVSWPCWLMLMPHYAVHHSAALVCTFHVAGPACIPHLNVTCRAFSTLASLRIFPQYPKIHQI